MKSKAGSPPIASARTVSGKCLCGAVEIKIEYPAFWAWHDHSEASRRAHGAAYATWLGCWRKKVHIAKGEKNIARYEEPKTGAVRSFCSTCGSPLIYERRSSKSMINVARGLFTARTGREPRYHIGIDQQVDWIYTGGPLVPLKGYPGVVWERPKAKKRKRADVFDESFEQAFRTLPSSREPKED
jgi:hypothetical protein